MEVDTIKRRIRSAGIAYDVFAGRLEISRATLFRWFKDWDHLRARHKRAVRDELDAVERQLLELKTGVDEHGEAVS